MYYEHERIVDYAECGVDARLKPGMILNYLQDAATDHCFQLGISGIDLLPQNLAWVIYRYYLFIHRYPGWKEQLFITTWRYPAGNLYELREFKVRDSRGNELITAKSAWILTRLDTRKPVRLKNNLPERVMTGEQFPIENDFADLPEPVEAGEPRTFWVRMHDLDFNRHVNNSIYPIWAMESVPAQTLDACLPSEISILYQGEAVFGDRVTVFADPLSLSPAPAYLHTIYNTGKKTAPITRLLTRWAPVEAFGG